MPTGLPERRATPDESAQDEVIASDRATPPAVLDTIARKTVVAGWANNRATAKMGLARVRVAANPSTSPKTLAWLAKIEDDYAVRTCVLQNPTTPISVLRQFITGDSNMTSMIVENPGVDDAFILEVVAAHEGNPDVALRALRNPALSDAAFEWIADTADRKWGETITAIRAGRRRGPRPGK